MIDEPRTRWGFRGAPTDALRTLVAAALLFGAGVAAGAARTLDPLALALAAGGVAALALGVRAQVQAERDAARLCDPQAPQRRPLAVSLAHLASRLEAVAQRAANAHPITGIATREPLSEIIAGDIAADARPRLIGAIRFTDFDRLAAFDQESAEQALKRFAERLVGATRPVHSIGQIDRDCFCIWFRGDIDLETAGAEFRALAYVAGQELINGEQILTPAIEVSSASFPDDGRDAAQLLVRVTAALSRPRISSLGDLTIARPPSVEEARRQFTLEQDLAQAIADDQLTMVFQPVVSLAAGRLIGAEALLRWTHPKLGPISPAHFMPLVEVIGLSDRYGLWVLNAACREVRRWQDAGLGDLKVAVNLSARQLLDPDLETKIRRTLERNRLSAGALEFELTETAAMADASRTRKIFAGLRAMGVKLAIDDFGSGYSSLSYLKNLPFDKLKIDREFVTEVQKRPDSVAICKALLELGRGLDLSVLAEGVETESEVQALRELGCDLFQGYYFSRPLPADEFLNLARSPEKLAPLIAPLSRPPSSLSRLA